MNIQKGENPCYDTTTVQTTTSTRATAFRFNFRENLIHVVVEWLPTKILSNR